MLVTKEDIYTHIFKEAVGKINRGNEAYLEEAIQSAINTVGRYLGKYNWAAIQLVEGGERLRYLELATYVKDIAKWRFIAPANPQVDYEDAEARYNLAIKALEDIRDGQIIAGWFLAPSDAEGTSQNTILSGSRPKFKHYFN